MRSGLHGRELGVIDSFQNDRRKTIAGEVAEAAEVEKVGARLGNRLGELFYHGKSDNRKVFHVSESRNSTPNSTSRKAERKQKEERRREELLDEIQQGVELEHRWIFELEPKH